MVIWFYESYTVYGLAHSNKQLYYGYHSNIHSIAGYFPFWKALVRALIKNRIDKQNGRSSGINTDQILFIPTLTMHNRTD